ncbi:MAG TPA: alkaline phosphatase family protein, partial [Bryobacteraceae bacterium]|nr:alkaline phosphatase family protein [Bryobacteraceae bacterium]
DWPVTVNAPLDWNLPEVFAKRRGGSMDLKSIEERAKPADLVAKISVANPSFAQEWMDDRTRTQAVVWLLKNAKPKLLLLHLVDLDSEQHDNAPFSKESIAILEYIDSMIGDIVQAMPKGTAFALVSDHGFEKVERIVNPKAAAPHAIQSPGLVIAPDAATATALRGQDGVGREVPKQEYESFASNLPKNPVAVFEPAPNVMFGAKAGKAEEIGNHGHWPTRYRSVYVLWGPGIKHENLPECALHDIAGRLAKVLGVAF